MIKLGALGTLILFILQVTGLISVSVLAILAPLLIGMALSAVFWVVALIVLAIGS